MYHSNPGTLKDLLLYFLKLGATTFGGPIALTEQMRRDLVEHKKWVSQDDYREGLALAQLAPGPLATQLAIYIGWLKAKVLGATLVPIAFISPPFLIVLIISILYLQYGGLSWIQGAFYGIGASVIALITHHAYKLLSKTLEKDILLWILAIVSAGITTLTKSEFLSLFLLSGLIAVIIKAPPTFKTTSALFSLFPAWLITGLHGEATSKTFWNIALFFTKAGAVVFGSGFAIVPFLHGGVVEQFRWLTDQQFMDAVAIAMITPGPVVITVAFIGYLAAGPLGACIATIGTFFPCYLFVVLPAPYYQHIAKNQQIKAFVAGVTAAALGALAGAALILGKRAIRDPETLIIALATLAIHLKFKKIPAPLFILLAGMAGWILTR